MSVWSDDEDLFLKNIHTQRDLEECTRDRETRHVVLFERTRKRNSVLNARRATTTKRARNLFFSCVKFFLFSSLNFHAFWLLITWIFAALNRIRFYGTIARRFDAFRAVECRLITLKLLLRARDKGFRLLPDRMSDSHWQSDRGILKEVLKWTKQENVARASCMSELSVCCLARSAPMGFLNFFSPTPRRPGFQVAFFFCFNTYTSNRSLSRFTWGLFQHKVSCCVLAYPQPATSKRNMKGTGVELHQVQNLSCRELFLLFFHLAQFAIRLSAHDDPPELSCTKRF